MVDLITESSCSRYIEFTAVGGIFNYNNGQIEQVYTYMYNALLVAAYMYLLYTHTFKCLIPSYNDT